MTTRTMIHDAAVRGVKLGRSGVHYAAAGVRIIGEILSVGDKGTTHRRRYQRSAFFTVFRSTRK